MNAYPIAIVKRAFGVCLLALALTAVFPRSGVGGTKPYIAKIQLEPPTLKVGGSADLIVTIEPQAPNELKAITPLQVTVSSNSGLVIDKPNLTQKDILDIKATTKSVKTKITTKTSGQYTITAALSFFLCTKEICQRHTDSITTTLEVK